MNEDKVQGRLGGGAYAREGECCVWTWSLNATGMWGKGGSCAIRTRALGFASPLCHVALGQVLATFATTAGACPMRIW
jgi:hypothetical protein